MGRKLDKLLGRTWKKTSKLKALLGLTVSRIAVLRNQRQVRAAQARDDVAILLQANNQDRALLRVELVFKEQNMLDVFVMIVGYCHLLTERAYLFEQLKECPEELREAVSSLAFAASRCGDLPELQEVRKIFSDKFGGKDFVAAASELRKSSAVNTEMIQKLSTKQASLESRIRMVREIAAERGIAVDIEDPSPPQTPEATQEKNMYQNPNSDQTSAPLEAGKKYKDVVSAAQDAFKSAQYAAVAARAAVELSRAESQGKNSGSDDSNRGSENFSKGKSFDVDVTSKHKVEPVHVYNSDTEEEEEEEELHRRNNINARRVQLEKSVSASSSSSSSASVDATAMKTKNSDQVRFDDDESETDEENNSSTGMKGLSYMNKPANYRRDATAQSSLANDTSRMGLRSDTIEKTPVNYIPERMFSGGNLYQNTENVLNMKQTGFQKPFSVRTRRGL